MTTPLQTGVRQVIVTDTDEELRTGEPEVAHIVKSDEANAAAKILEARIYGTPVEALCGTVFVPQRDPKRLPVCAACKDIYDTYRVYDEGLPESPES